MSDKYFVGLDVLSSSNNGKYKPVSRVTLIVDDSKAITAGDDTGYEIIADCPHATQAMVDSLLASFKGHEYQSYSAVDSNVDPSAELGDGITVSGIYSVLSRVRDDGSGFPSLEAPGKAEDEDEYPGGGPMTQAFNRELAATRSLISKTAEEIRLEVGGKIGEEEAKSMIQTTLEGITLSVTNGSTSSSLVLKAGETVLSSQLISMSGLVTFTGLSNGTTTIDGDCIKTGIIDSDRVRVNSLYGSEIYLKFLDYYDYNNNPVYNNGGKITVTGSATSTLGKAIDLTSFGALRLNAQVGDAYIGSGDGYVTLGGHLGNSCIGFFRPGNDNLYTLGVSWSRWGDIYSSNSAINTSDRNAKDCITYGLDKYHELYKRLKPVSYMFKNGTSGRTHIGFISQDIEEALSNCGLTSLDFAGFVKSPKRDDNEQVIEGEYDYALRYGEFIALNTHMIQKLMDRVSALEAKG